MPVYVPPGPTPAMRKVTGGAGRAVQVRSRYQSAVASNYDLAAQGVRFQSQVGVLVVDEGQEVNTAKGQFLVRRVQRTSLYGTRTEYVVTVDAGGAELAVVQPNVSRRSAALATQQARSQTSAGANALPGVDNPSVADTNPVNQAVLPDVLAPDSKTVLTQGAQTSIETAQSSTAVYDPATTNGYQLAADYYESHQDLFTNPAYGAALVNTNNVLAGVSTSDFLTGYLGVTF